MAPNVQVLQETAVEAFPMSIVGFAVAFSVAKVYAVKHDYTIDGNQVFNSFKIYNIKLKASGDSDNKTCFLSHLAIGADSLWS